MNLSLYEGCRVSLLSSPVKTGKTGDIRADTDRLTVLKVTHVSLQQRFSDLCLCSVSFSQVLPAVAKLILVHLHWQVSQILDRYVSSAALFSSHFSLDLLLLDLSVCDLSHLLSLYLSSFALQFYIFSHRLSSPYNSLFCLFSPQI